MYECVYAHVYVFSVSSVTVKIEAVFASLLTNVWNRILSQTKLQNRKLGIMDNCLDKTEIK